LKTRLCQEKIIFYMLLCLILTLKKQVGFHFFIKEDVASNFPTTQGQQLRGKDQGEVKTPEATPKPDT
jgi:hypothetical protein